MGGGVLCAVTLYFIVFRVGMFVKESLTLSHSSSFGSAVVYHWNRGSTAVFVDFFFEKVDKR